MRETKSIETGLTGTKSPNISVAVNSPTSNQVDTSFRTTERMRSLKCILLIIVSSVTLDIVSTTGTTAVNTISKPAIPLFFNRQALPPVTVSAESSTTTLPLFDPSNRIIARPQPINILIGELRPCPENEKLDNNGECRPVIKLDK
ncbi:uncharacterized protein LOC143153035 [Ptiloglossa arizonensis]|uniref:uncharacterized protein LOC143153035 n=1 Tax=Ptiloglossa arizonensis TaxID=3350558 RepID=UPI003F9EF76D